MTEILKKISSYNLFNYLFPGVLFSAIATVFTKYALIQDDIIVGLFTYYFIGLVISRLGSIIIEPLLKTVSLLKFSDYKDYVSATKKDSSIELFSEINNMYRTICSMLSMVLVLKLYEYLEFRFTFLNDVRYYLLIVALLVIFLLSYKKQTSYINKRIKHYTNN